MQPCSPITLPLAAEVPFPPARPAQRKIAGTCEPLHKSFGPAVLPLIPDNHRSRDMIYSGFEIQSFEAGSGLWHARIQRADQEPVVIDGMPFPTLEVGIAWSDPDAAIADAKAYIDRYRPIYQTAEHPSSS
jgi:hypothetical protein